jgi:hypothetical protein
MEVFQTADGGAVSPIFVMTLDRNVFTQNTNLLAWESLSSGWVCIVCHPKHSYGLGGDDQSIALEQLPTLSQNTALFPKSADGHAVGTNIPQPTRLLFVSPNMRLFLSP